MRRTIPSSTQQLRVAAYCRIAGGSEGQNNVVEAQRAYYTEMINARPDWTMAGIFIDAGGSLSRYPEFQKMLRKCRQKKIDLILVKSISRFARNTVDCLKYIRTLRELGVTVIFEKKHINTSDIDSDWDATVMGVFAQAEIESIPHNICTRCFRCMKGTGRGKRAWKKAVQLSGFPERTIVYGEE